MLLTVVEVDDKNLFQGVKVRNKRSGCTKVIFVVPDGKSLWQCVQDGSFTESHVNYSTVMNNKQNFELLPEDQD